MVLEVDPWTEIHKEALGSGRKYTDKPQRVKTSTRSFRLAGAFIASGGSIDKNVIDFNE